MDKLKYGYKDHLIGKDHRLHYGKGFSKSLIPCQRVADGNLVVGILNTGNNLKAERFCLAGKDRQPISLQIDEGEGYDLTYPGKSALLVFDQYERVKMGEFILATFARNINRNDHLFVATVDLIEEAGWSIYWTPLPERESWLHTRIVPQCYSHQGKDPGEEEMKALQSVFVKEF